MFEALRRLLLRALRVPAEPDAPFGEPSSIQVFRASRKLYWLRMIRWSVGQAAALIGIVIWLGIIATTEQQVEKVRAEPGLNRRPGRMAKSRRQTSPWEAFKQLAARLPGSVFGWLWAVEAAGIVAYAGQLLVTYMAVRLDYEMRWYLVTDRSLRIRSGLWKVQEMTMSFANLQQVMVSQGPLQRLLGIADVRVQSAGGGGSGEAQHGQTDTMHTGVFHGVEQAVEIRDLILKRLRHFRETGLGDPDELRHQALPTATPATSAPADSALLGAARELLQETRQLRQALE